MACGRRHDGGIFDAHAVVDFEFLFETAQDGDGIVNGRFADCDGLETPGQRGVLSRRSISIFGRVVASMQRSSPRASAGLSMLARINGAFRSAGADESVELIDEADDFAVRFGDFLEDGFAAVLKLAARTWCRATMAWRSMATRRLLRS